MMSRGNRPGRGGRRERRDHPGRDLTVDIVLITTTIVWVANFVAGLVLHGYDGSAINTTFPAVIGALLVIRQKQDDDDDDEDDDRETPRGAAS